MTASAKLAAYLRRWGLTQETFAERARLPGPQVSMYLSGRRRPGLAAALRIQRVTRGAVRAADWLLPSEA